jgi:hypothetical protein
MRDVSVATLIDLVVAGTRDPRQDLHKMFDWFHSRHLTITKALLAASASLFAALLAIFLGVASPDGSPLLAKVDWWKLAIVAIAAILLLAWSAIRLWQLARLPAYYTAALDLFERLRASRQFYVLARRGR